MDDEVTKAPSFLRHPFSFLKMDYSQSLRYLNSFVNLEKLSQLPQNPFFNLKRMEYLLKIAGHPEKKFFPVLIAGTTGKGSTGFFLESILKANGIRVGYYHSPHIEDPRERIRVQGRMISPKLWTGGLSEIRRLLYKNPLPEKLGVLTYFEILTFLAILAFSKTGVRIGIFEIGLGGRLDATNILKAPVVLLTPVHLDHEAFLGNTIAKIAREKAAIIKPHNHIVVGWQKREALTVIQSAVQKNKGFLWKAQPIRRWKLGLAGDFQKWNAGMAMKAAEVLNRHFHFPIRAGFSKQGLQCADWKGRMERFRKFGREFILDGAHNPISSLRLMQEMKKSTKNRDPWLIFGAMRDKNSRKMLEILSRFFQKVILVQIKNHRAKSLGTLSEESKTLFNCMIAAQNTAEAFQLFMAATKSKSLAVITGSFYLVGEARRILRNA